MLYEVITPYTTIIAVSVIPAILYFASVAFFVRIEAKRSNVQQVEDDTPTAMEVLKRGGLPFLLPVTVLITLLVVGFTPTYAAGISILAVVVSSWLTPNKMGPRAIMEALALGSRNMVMSVITSYSIHYTKLYEDHWGSPYPPQPQHERKVLLA